MKSSFSLILFFIFIVCSCRHNGSGSIVNAGKVDSTKIDSSKVLARNKKPLPSSDTGTSTKAFVFSTIDSLNKYEDSAYTTYYWDSTGMQYGTAMLYINKLNGVWVGIAPTSDSTYSFFQEKDKTWAILYTFDDNFDIDNVNEIKLHNYDIYNLIITSSTGYGPSGNKESQFFSFIPGKKVFMHSNPIDLWNVYYDSIKQVIGSKWEHSMAGEGVKELYKIDKTKLVFLKGIAIGPGKPFTDYRYGYLRYFTFRTTKEEFKKTDEITLKLVEYKNYSKMNNIYEHSLWDSSNDF